MVPPALVGHKFPVRLNNYCVEVFDAFNNICGHSVAGSQGEDVGDYPLKHDNIFILEINDKA